MTSLACWDAGDQNFNIEIGDKSCVGDQSESRCDYDNPKQSCAVCKKLKGIVGDGSCKRGTFACSEAWAIVGDKSCIGSRACKKAGSEDGTVEIGDGSCNGPYACADTHPPDLDTPPTDPTIYIGDHACKGYKACC